jgi:predicted porin
MKKSLVALAVLAASGASFAQSTVTVYGLADIWFGNSKSDNGAGTTTSNTVLESGGVNGSRWGLKGSEDLGGGLSTTFKLEQGFKLDTGAGTAGQAFSRVAQVGFAGGFGAVDLGKTWTAFDDIAGASATVFNSALSPANNAFKTPGYSGNPGNTVRYTSPTFSGATGAVSYSLDEGVAGKAVTSLSLAYEGGPLAAQFGYQSEDGAAAASDVQYTVLAASYNFGVATGKFTYGKAGNMGGVSGAEASEWEIGADYPVSASLTLSAGFAKSDDNATAGSQSRKSFGIGAAYTLSKRTFLYGGLVHASATQGAAADSTADVYAIGVQHKF